MGTATGLFSLGSSVYKWAIGYRSQKTDLFIHLFLHPNQERGLHVLWDSFDHR